MKSKILCAVLLSTVAGGTFVTPALAQDDPFANFTTVTEDMLNNPADGDWLTFRRTRNHWGYSPLDQITLDNVGDLRMEWSLGMESGPWEGTPLVHDGIMFLAQANDVVVALDATTGDTLWEYRRQLPADLNQYTLSFGIHNLTRTLAIENDFIVFDTAEGFLVALDAKTGQLVWETQIYDYTTSSNWASAGPVIIDGKVLTNRSCAPGAGPTACFIAAHDLASGEELWRTYTIPQEGQPGFETWGDVPYESRNHVGSWMPPSYDPELNLVYYGTSVTAPYPKFMVGGDVENGEYLYQTSTLAINPDTGEIVWYYQHSRDHWDIDHPFGRILVDTVVSPNAEDVAWISPGVTPGEERHVLTGIPGKTGVIYTLDRATGEFLWARPTTPQNVIVGFDPDGRVQNNPELMLTEADQEVLVCGGYVRNHQEGAYSPETNTMYFGLNRPTCSITSFSDEIPGIEAGPIDLQMYLLTGFWNQRNPGNQVTEEELGPLDDSAGYTYAVDASTGETKWVLGTGNARIMSLVATGGGLLFGGSPDRRFYAIDQETGEIVWQTILGNNVSGYPISYEAGGRQFIAVGVSGGLNPASVRNVLYTFALPE